MGMAKSFSQNEKAPGRGFLTLAHAGDPTPVNWIDQMIGHFWRMANLFPPPHSRSRETKSAVCDCPKQNLSRWRGQTTEGVPMKTKTGAPRAFSVSACRSSILNPRKRYAKQIRGARPFNKPPLAPPGQAQNDRPGYSCERTPWVLVTGAEPLNRRPACVLGRIPFDGMEPTFRHRRPRVIINLKKPKTKQKESAELNLPAQRRAWNAQRSDAKKLTADSPGWLCGSLCRLPAAGREHRQFPTPVRACQPLPARLVGASHSVRTARSAFGVGCSMFDVSLCAFCAFSRPFHLFQITNRKS